MDWETVLGVCTFLGTIAVILLTLYTYKLSVVNTVLQAMETKTKMANDHFAGAILRSPEDMSAVVTELHRSFEIVKLYLERYPRMLKGDDKFFLRAWKLSLDVGIIQILEKEDLVTLIQYAEAGKRMGGYSRDADIYSIVGEQWKSVQRYFKTGK